jgi:hypothetical protein
MLTPKIEDAKAHIKATEKVLASLESERATVTQSAKDHEQLLSPVRRVPTTC